MKGSSLTNEKTNESIHRKWLITEKNGHKKLRNEIFEKLLQLMSFHQLFDNFSFAANKKNIVE